jgi:hypothetical protein
MVGSEGIWRRLNKWMVRISALVGQEMGYFGPGCGLLCAAAENYFGFGSAALVQDVGYLGQDVGYFGSRD